MNKTIVIINGSGGCGKDTFINLCSNYANIVNVSSIDKVRMAANLLGCNSKLEKDRMFLSDLKSMSKEYYNHPVEYMLSEIRKFKNDNDDILFLHIREIEEIETMRNMLLARGFNVVTLLIVRDAVNKITSNKSDANVYNYNYDILIYNSDTLGELELKAKDFLFNIK